MKKNGLLIFCSLFLFLFFGTDFSLLAQPVTTIIYATAPGTSYTTGNATTTTRTAGNIVSSTTQRGYADFDLSSIPAGSVIDSVEIGFNVSAYNGFGAPSGWVTYGFPGPLDTAASAASLYADMVAGTALNMMTYGTATGNKVLYSTVAADTFIEQNIGDSIAISFTSGGGRRYTITGEAGTAAMTGTHAPYLAITYCPPVSAGTVSGPSNVCPGSVVSLSSTVSGGVWYATNGNATVDASGNVTGVTSGFDTIIYAVTNACGTGYAGAGVLVNAAPAFTVTATPDTICNGGSSLLTATEADTILQQNFNSSIAPWGQDTTGSTALPAAAYWNDVPSGYVNELGTYSSPDGSPFALINADTSGLGTVTVASLNSTVFSTVGLDSLTLSFQQFYQNYTDNNAEVLISTDGGATFTSLVNYATMVPANDSIGSKTAFATETISLTPYVGNPNVVLVFYYNSPYGFSWAIDNVAISTSVQPTWSSAVANLYDDPAFTTPDISGTYIDTVYAYPAPATATTTYTYYATESNGTCSTTDSTSVTVLIPVSPISGSTTICTGTPDALTDGTTGGTWTATNGNATVDPMSGSVSGVSAGADTIIYTVSTVCGAATDSFVVNVTLAPDAGTITGTGYICIGTTIPFTDGAGGGTGSWYTAFGNATVDASGNVTGAFTGTDTVYYAVTNSCGTATASYFVNVASTFNPALTVTESSNGDTSCFGVQVIYTATAVDGGDVPRYQWSVNGIPLGSADTFAYTPNNGDVITCTLISDAPCLGSPATVTDTVIMVVNTGTPPTISISDGMYGDTVCISTVVPYTAAITDGGSAPSFLWSVNGIPYATGNPFDYVPSDGDVINCVLTSSNACAVPNTATSNSIVMLVNTVETPAVTITAIPGDTVCAGYPVTITASALYGGFSPFFRWTKNGINVATGPDFTFTPTAGGDSIYCMMASSSSCSILDSVFSQTLHLGIDSPVIPSITITSFTADTITVGAMDTFVAVVSNATSPSYQWQVNGVDVSGATSALYIGTDTIAGPAAVTCIVTSNTPCHDTALSNSVIIIAVPADTSTTSVKQILTAAGTSLELLPNPNKGAFSVQGVVPADTRQVTLQVTDVVGRVVYSETVPVQGGTLRWQVIMNAQTASGVYLMHITADNVNQVIRFSMNK